MPLELQQRLTKSLKRLLRPLLRFCVRHSIKFQDMLDLLKAAFIEVAEEELRSRDESINTSRLAMVTGLQRKDISRLQGNDPSTDSGASLLSRIIGQWQQHKDFCQRPGSPRLLGFEGAESEFAELVKSISKDINPYTVLFELERAGLVSRQDNHLELRTATYNISGVAQFEQAFELLERDSSDLLQAVEQNVLHSLKVPNLHQHTEYDNICVDALPQIQKWLLDKGTTFHEQARNYLAKFDQDVNPRLRKKQGGARVALGAFSLTVQPKTETHD